MVLAVAASPAIAKDYWTVPGSTTATTINGTLHGTAITLSAPARLTMATAPATNPPFNSYDIWDNTAAANAAQLWPASAAGAMQLIMALSGTATPGTPAQLRVSFAQPVRNPRLLIYSIDNSVLDFSATRTVDAAPAVLSVTGNSVAVYTGATQTLGTTGTVSKPEGCSNAPAGRACAVVSFTGVYSEIDVTLVSTTGGSDGLGTQWGLSYLMSASPDSGSATAGVASTPVADVRANDAANGAAATSALATLATVGTWPAGLSLDPATGAVRVAASVAPGNYALDYTLCDAADPGNCATTTVSIAVVTPSPQGVPLLGGPWLTLLALLTGGAAALGARRR